LHIICLQTKPQNAPSTTSSKTTPPRPPRRPKPPNPPKSPVPSQFSNRPRKPTKLRSHIGKSVYPPLHYPLLSFLTNHSHLQISPKRRVTIQEYKGITLIGLREYYEKDGKTLPGKSGISLTAEQWMALTLAMPEIKSALEKRGVEFGDAEEDEEEEIKEEEDVKDPEETEDED
jgi:hypothetical protein